MALTRHHAEGSHAFKPVSTDVVALLLWGGHIQGCSSVSTRSIASSPFPACTLTEAARGTSCPVSRLGLLAICGCPGLQAAYLQPGKHAANRWVHWYPGKAQCMQFSCMKVWHTAA